MSQRRTSAATHSARVAGVVLVGAAIGLSLMSTSCGPQCQANQVRRGDRCLATCNAQADCGRGFRCEDGVCLEGMEASASSSSSSGGASSSSSSSTSGSGGGPLEVTPTAVALRVGQRQVFSPHGGQPPYTFSVAQGPGTVTAGGEYTRPWSLGPAIIRVSDGAGANVDARVDFLASALQVGSSADDNAWDVDVSPVDGSILVAGQAAGAAVAGRWKGGLDLVVFHFSSDGELLHAFQDGTTQDDVAVGVFRQDDSIIVVGHTNGQWERAPAGFDLLLARYQLDGTRVSAMQLGAPGDQLGLAATYAGGRVCLAASTADAVPGGGSFQGGASDALVVTIAPGGSSPSWQVSTWGTTGYDTATACTLGMDGTASVAGYTQGAISGTNAGGFDATLTTLAANGNITAHRQAGGAGDDRLFGAAPDTASNGTWTCGYTSSASLAGGAGTTDNNAFTLFFPPVGQPIAAIHGTSAADYCYGLDVLPGGNPVIVGGTTGSLGGTNQGVDDVFILAGTSTPADWTVQAGTTAGDSAFAVAVGDGVIWVVGDTFGAMDGATALGGRDIFVIKLAADGQRL